MAPSPFQQRRGGAPLPRVGHAKKPSCGSKNLQFFTLLVSLLLLPLFQYNLQHFIQEENSTDQLLKNTQKAFQSLIKSDDDGDDEGPSNAYLPDKAAQVKVQKYGVGSRADLPANKTLVVVIGNLRGGEKAWATMQKHLLDVNHADLALLIGETTIEERQNVSLFSRAKYHWPVPEYTNWIDAMSLLFDNGTAWQQPFFEKVAKDSQVFGGVRYRYLDSPESEHVFKGSVIILLAFRYFLSQKIQQLKLTEHYERFVITRSDHYYLCDHNLSKFDPKFMWVPHGERYGGVTDRHLVVSSDLVLQAIDILPNMMVKHPDWFNWSDIYLNLERILLQSWTKMGLEKRLRRFKRVMFTCAVEGDPTRWRSRGELTKEGVYLKYPKEYNRSRQVCDSRQKTSSNLSANFA